MLEVYIDGASAGNPGPSGVGIFMKGEGLHEKISLAIPDTNNHVAEFTALVKGLAYAKETGSSFVSMRSDSKIVVSSVDKAYVKNEEYKPYLEQALMLIEQFDLFFIKWIPEKENKAADALARAAIQKREK